MSNLLIHSMSEFSEIILEALDIAEACRIVEIGAEFGGMSQALATFAGQHGGCLTSIDPAPKQEFVDWAATSPHVRHLPLTSLEAIPNLHDIQAWVIDGDHNYYTVYHELHAIDALCRRDEQSMLAFLHDVSWPSGRRDMYYAPEQIPADWRHPYDFESGVVLDSPELGRGRGFRGCGQFALALHEGGPRNGVLTAVEDFMDELRDDGRTFAWAHVPAVFGLGILFDADAPWAPELAARVAHLHDNPLLRRLEENRLRNYLTVIDYQDRQNA